MAPEGPASQVSSPSRLQIVRYGVPTLIGIAYFLFRFDLGYRPFLVDEHLFLDAMREGGLTFFPGYIGFLWCARDFPHISSGRVTRIHCVPNQRIVSSRLLALDAEMGTFDAGLRTRNTCICNGSLSAVQLIDWRYLSN